MNEVRVFNNGGCVISRLDAIKKIIDIIDFGGLPRAIKIYDYLSANRTIDVTHNQINEYFGLGNEEDL